MRCLYCNKPVRKYTRTVYVEQKKSPFHNNGMGSRHVYPDPLPRNIADCRRLTNQQVVSVSYGLYYDGENHPDLIRSFNEWDGVSYLPTAQFFCSGDCADFFAIAAVKAGYRIQRTEKE